jgi:hypothetical protein
MPLTPFPPTPQPSDSRPIFSAKSYAFVGHFDTLVDEVNAVEANVTAKEASATASATAAANSASNAAAIGAYKGAWSSLSGALAIPATVSHNGAVWILVANTANVTTITPGVSNQWLPAQSLTHVVHVSGTTWTGVAYQHVSFENAAQSTASFPPSPGEGTLFDFTNTNGRYDNVFTANGSLVEGDADDITLNVRSGRFKFMGASAGGWRLQS